MSNAVYAFVYALDEFHRKICAGRSGVCEKLKEMAGTTQLASQLFHHLRNISFMGKYDKANCIRSIEDVQSVIFRYYIV